jgi:hypothetical protein
MKDVKRKLYGARKDMAIARYELSKGLEDREVALRVFDVVGGDALVFLTPAKVRLLISDLLPHSGIATVAKRRRSGR